MFYKAFFILVFCLAMGLSLPLVDVASLGSTIAAKTIDDSLAVVSTESKQIGNVALDYVRNVLQVVEMIFNSALNTVRGNIGSQNVLSRITKLKQAMTE